MKILSKAQIIKLHTQLIDVVLKVASGEYDYEKFLNWVIIHQIVSR